MVLTDKSGCRRNDKILLFPSNLPVPVSSTTPQPPPTPFPRLPESTPAGVNTRWKLALGISLPTACLLLALVIYWRIRQRSKIVKEKPRAIIPSPAAAPGYEKPELQGIGICELPAASLPELDHEHIHEASTGAMASELHPTHLLEMDTASLPELDAVGTCVEPPRITVKGVVGPDKSVQKPQQTSSPPADDYPRSHKLALPAL